ncbi:MAG: hypothetical protein CMJ01_00785 [Pelagibacteraceae bacterium]|nr:hypothetical protein [Pelagibacteraceae bacterium]|tara:strand:+ start:7624 stop:7857 length:234 start_codon:yes stop_codon:yes gene_type:complete
MIEYLIAINNYGIFVWLSFGITIFVCAILYYKTFKTLKKYEKDFAEDLYRLSEKDRKLISEKSKVASQILTTYDKSI